MVSLMTALWFGVLEAPDRVSVKPHASPVLHALNYLLGRLDRSYLTTLRQFGGLQSYPSRTKDPDPVDYSTGSVGLGATAPVWGAIAHRYVAGHFDVPVGGRQIALIGDAELDEGACWEAIADPMVSKLGEVMWVVDLNRQSLDRVVPDIAAGRLQAMFEAAGWHCVMVKYGPRLAARPELRERIDLMPNEEYQRLLRAPRRRAARAPRGRDRRPRRRRAAGDVPRPRRPRPRRADRRLPPGRRRARPPERRVRLHDQGLDAADRGPPGEPLGAADRARSTRRSPSRSGPTRATRGRASPTAARPRSCARRRRGGSRARSRRSSSSTRPRCRPTSAASTAAASRRSRRSGASSSTSRARRPRWRSASSRCRRTSARRPTSAAGSTRRASGRSATGSTGSPTTPTRSCAGASPTTAATSSSGSPRSTSSACSASWARRGRAPASRCCRSARSTTRSSRARSSPGRSASTPAASRSSSARRAA